MIRRNSRLNMLTGRIYAEGNAAPAGTEGAGGGNSNPTPSGAGGGSDSDKKFTQEDLNRILAEDRRKHQQSVETLKKQVEQFQGTAKEKEALQQKLTDMEKQFLTKEQLAAQEQEKAKQKYETELAEAKSAADQWKNVFIKNVAETAIARAAVENKAFNPEQLQLLLGTQVQVRQKTDTEGRPTMDFETILPVPTKDKDGKPVVLELPVAEGVKKMRENPQYANLFLVDGTPGTGAHTINNSPVPVTSGPPSDPAQYRAWRAAQQKAGRV